MLHAVVEQVRYTADNIKYLAELVKAMRASLKDLPTSSLSIIQWEGLKNTDPARTYPTSNLYRIRRVRQLRRWLGLQRL